MSLKRVMSELKKYSPQFADFTWGAGGSTSDLTVSLCKLAKDEFGLVPNMHLTCTNMDFSKIEHALKECKASGIRNIVALRGDPPVGQERWVAAEGGLTCALDLVNYIRKTYADYFCLSVAGYPEGHPNAMTQLEIEQENSLSFSEKLRCSVDEVGEGAEMRKVINVCRDDDYAKEMIYLKSKVDAGADCIITQMFFDTAVYKQFVDDCRSYGIHVPIIPGIMCIANYGGFKRMIKFCKTRVTDVLMNAMEEIKDDVEAIKRFGVEFGINMCKELLSIGAPGLHFYTLNSSGVVISILEGLGYHPKQEEPTETMVLAA